jgi:hypothetical protein
MIHGFLGSLLYSTPEHRGHKGLTQGIGQSATGPEHFPGHRSQAFLCHFCKNQYPLSHR